MPKQIQKVAEPKTEIAKSKISKPDRYYYLTVFLLSGHTDWRCHLGGKKDNFENEAKNFSNKKQITNKRVFTIDSATGEIKTI